ncbi:MAG: MmgE/PrpD family protein [Rhizobiaceae bacterium]|jgi:2-methylcitrate dehydratase PrpD|uniref:MmgE/PrpD family protein n=1 Tax=Neoaquamicrobium sediminum TaxID=1849104 RepID=UPI001565BC6E|nr:MmgE/PrpD family protein [Mesorhizobium sediminum]MCV0398338.1 MmgE/PrpD family protein [Rhizobiaceae bacterium]MCV0406658.1 MmgE/PrpD family protein [Rhizobiaceae bacterium]NRC57134.1 MmgE/PrpD family protein [Mesorhizobium sediminum]
MLSGTETSRKRSGEHGTAELAEFASALSIRDIPEHAVERCVDLFVDWAGSALSGARHRAILAVDDFAKEMGPNHGRSEVLISGRMTSPLFAAMVNAAASHVSEQDDVHNGSVFHPGAVVFPAALAVAQNIGASGRDFLTACVAGYETGIRAGEYLGLPHYKIFHTTGTAGTLAAAAAAGRLLGLGSEQMLNAFGSAGTQAAGVWEFLRDAADSKQLHTGKAAANGMTAASLAARGFTGARRILEGEQGMGAGMSRNCDPAKITAGLGVRWALAETSFKFHASCRHTHPAADALLKILHEHDLRADDIQHVTAHVHQAAIDVLGSVVRPATVHQAKFSMPATLGLIAVHRRAGLDEFDTVLEDEAVRELMRRVDMIFDPEVEQNYPATWMGKVSVTIRGGTVLTARVDEPKGDPGNTLTRDEIEKKARTLAQYGGALDGDGWTRVSRKLWSVASLEVIGSLLR